MRGLGQIGPIRRLPVVGLRAFWTPIVLSLGVLVIVLAVWASSDTVLALAVTAALIRAVMMIGLYIFIGNSSVLTFGHATFMMVGAYGVAWLTLRPFNKSFALQLPEVLATTQYPLFPSALAAAALAAVVAFVVGIPIMRLSGIAAAIATLGVLGMFKTFYSNWSEWTLGAAIMPGIPIHVDMWVALSWVVVAWRFSSPTSVSAPSMASRSAPRARTSSRRALRASASRASG